MATPRKRYLCSAVMSAVSASAAMPSSYSARHCAEALIAGPSVTLQVDFRDLCDMGDLSWIAPATCSCCRSAAWIGAALPEIVIPPDHTVLGAGHGFPPISDTEVALVAAPETSAGSRRLRGTSGQLLSHARSPDGGMSGSALLQAPPTSLGRQLPGTVCQPVLHRVTRG